MDQEEIDNRSAFHPADADRGLKHEQLRAGLSVLLSLINEICPESEEKVQAQNRADEAVMWANAALARHS